jgi:uncharacterized Zn-binding protein involved in type VI secretion
MGAPIGRVGDIGIGVCPWHTSPVSYTTTISSGAATASADGKQIALVGSIGVASCGHPTCALSGSTIADVKGIKIHRKGDIGANGGNYVLVSGSPTSDSA